MPRVENRNCISKRWCAASAIPLDLLTRTGKFSADFGNRLIGGGLLERTPPLKISRKGRENRWRELNSIVKFSGMLMKLRLQMSGSLFQPKNNNSSFEICTYNRSNSRFLFSFLLPSISILLLLGLHVIIVNTANIVNKETGFLPWKMDRGRQLHSFRIESPVRVSSSRALEIEACRAIGTNFCTFNN